VALPDINAAPPPVPPAKPPGRVKVFACPNCGGAITLRAVGNSITVQCSHCSSLIDVANETYQVIAAAQAAIAGAAIEMGKRGKIDGIEWEVVGFQERCDESGSFEWTEYLLFNPYYGYRFLIDEEGNWTLVKMLNRDVPGVGISETVTFEGRDYKRFSEGKSYTRRIGGEFYWRASTDDVSDGVDYVSPPYRLFGERNNDEIIVSHGQYVAPDDIAAAFGIEAASLAGPEIGANQPNPYAAAKAAIVPIAILALVGATAVQFAGLIMTDRSQINAATYTFTPADKDKAVTGPTFTLSGTSNIEVDSIAQLNNDWLELDLSLVNTQTEQTFQTTQGMEYYSGYDSDGSWSEGDNSSSVVFSRVPAGTYKLLIEPDAGSFAKAPASTTPTSVLTTTTVEGVTFPSFTQASPPAAPAIPPVLAQVKVMHGTINWSNYFIALLLLILLPGYILARYWWFEASRWAASGTSSGSGSSSNDDDSDDNSSSWSNEE